MDEVNLIKVLKECNKSAKIGYEIASEQEKNLNKTLDSAQKKIQGTIQNLQRSPCCTPELTKSLQKQLDDIKESFKQLSYSFNEDLQTLQKNLSHFSITLFGRTMAGKSTLMEILTEGDGSSIGKGAQRTTRDIRKYTWNGLEITDVPGIGAFEGEDDEKLAFESAKTADLILFLITDDAPQQKEAECFSRIVNLGKPIICVMNVKSSISENKSLKLALRDVNNRFDMERLIKIRDQFRLFSEQFGQTWNHIPFVYVHLKSAFAASKIDEPPKRESLLKVSRINNLKMRIVGQVKTNGKFYRIKTFIDIISNPILGSMEELLAQSQINNVLRRNLSTNKCKLESWKNDFYRDSKTRITSLITKIKSELNGEIASFAEEHYEDKNAGNAWKELLESQKLKEKCQELINNLKFQCNDKLAEIGREGKNELSYIIIINKPDDDESINMETITDFGKIWKWVTTIASGVSSFLSKWISLVVTGVGLLGSFFFDSREEKEHKARKQLEKKLQENISKMCESLEKQMNKELNSLLHINIEVTMAEIDKIDSVLSQLADTQNELAWNLNNHMLNLNYKIVTEAIRLICAKEYQYHVQSVSRIPGNTSLILLKDSTEFPKRKLRNFIKYKLHKLMGERIRLCTHQMIRD